MTIITNWSNEQILLKNICMKKGVIAEAEVGRIDEDYSLIRYLGQVFNFRDVIINNSGYPIIAVDNTTTTLYRLILEYYSKYDMKLKDILQNKDYEINHISKDKLDNRLCNLEIVTHQNNIRHSKGLEYEVVMSSKQLQMVQRKSIDSKQQIIDKAYLMRVSGLFYKAIGNNEINEKILKNAYIVINSFRYATNSMGTPEASLFATTRFPILPQLYKILPTFHTNYIEKLIYKHNQYIFKVVTDSNQKLLYRSIDRYPYIKQILSKYKILDREAPSNNIMLEFHQKIYEKNQYTVESNGDILLTISIKSSIKSRGKHKAFLILYYLGILERKANLSNNVAITIQNKKYVHIPSFIKIVPLTESHIKAINVKCKELVQLNYNSIRYFTIREAFGEEIADTLYNHNPKCKNHYYYGVRAKADIISILKKDETHFKSGFISKDKIVYEVKQLNKNRKQNGANYSKIYKSFYRFVSSLFLYNKEIKETLEQLDLTYISLTTQIIQNIKQHQKQNNIPDTTNTLKPNQKVIVLKKLIK